MERAKRIKITPPIWDNVLDFIDEHPELATGQFEGPHAKQHLQSLWIELTKKLNSLGHGTKTTNKWQKSFTDWKYNVKQKYAEIKMQRMKIEGKPFVERKMTPQEKRLLVLIGGSSLEGGGVLEEVGLGIPGPTIAHQVEAGPSTSRQMSHVGEDVVYVPQSPQSIEVVIVDPGSPSETSETISTSRSPTPQPSTSAHTTLPHRPSGRPGGSVSEQFQAETLNELRTINNNLKDISNNMQRLTDAIVEYLNRNNKSECSGLENK